MSHAASSNLPSAPTIRPWPALWAMVIGFFMILVDSTIVSVATPDIQQELETTYTIVIWVTSAYLLAYAVPLLITGRLGDRFGPKNIYLIGLALFTVSSLWCGLTGSIETLIAARVVQGFGASMMTPQTMAVITRTFAANERGKAMALWGATAGVATLVGPVLGGVLTEHAGWEWIFFINVPVGVVGFVLAWRLVPSLETHTHRFDLLGVALSAAAMFLVVFGIQEGEEYDWGQITGVLSVPLLIGLGLVTFGLFFWWQLVNQNEPLLPLQVFRDRSFSVSNVAIACVSFAITGMAFPFMLWAQIVRGMSPTESGLLFVPMAVMSVVMAPIVGRYTDTTSPRLLASIGFAISAAVMLVLHLSVDVDTPIWIVLLALGGFGLGNSFLWAPLAATATRKLPPQLAGAGSGVYNAVRQVGAVMGSAAIAAAISARLAAHLPGVNAQGAARSATESLPPEVAERFAAAMTDTLWVPFGAFVVGFVVVQLFATRDSDA
jgi:EmrB/QacA subfamily drug resistance transporter